jgi:hypothetical protein
VRRRRSAPALLASGGASPLRYKWQTGKLASGPHTMDARAIDAAGPGASARITMTEPYPGMSRQDGNAEGTWDADYWIGAEGATEHPNMRRDIKLKYHRTVMSSASGSRGSSRRWAGSPLLRWCGSGWGVWAAVVVGIAVFETLLVRSVICLFV